MSTDKQQEYKDMISNIKTKSINKIKHKCKIQPHLTFIKAHIEAGNSVEDAAEQIKCSGAHLRKWLKNSFGMDWYNHNCNCKARTRIMREEWREEICALRGGGRTYKAIAEITGLGLGTVNNYIQYYKENDR